MAYRYGSLTLQIKALSNLADIGSTYTDIISASGSQKLNAIGSGSFSFPRHSALYTAVTANIGQVAYIYVTDQVAGGAALDVCTIIMQDINTETTENGMITTITGSEITDQLSYANLGDDTIDDGSGGRNTAGIAAIMGYAPPGWTHNGTEVVKGVYLVSRGDTVFQALTSATKQSGEFFRPSAYSPPVKQINWYNSPDSSGITLRMPTDPTVYDGSSTVGIVKKFKLSEDLTPTITAIRPYGSGLEDGRLDITVINSGDTGGDPAGYTTTFASNLIVNTTLEASLGYRILEDVDFSHIKVEDPNNPAHVTTAAVALWDEAIYFLQQRDSSRKYYDAIDCVIPADIRPGSTVTIVYAEYEGGTSGGSAIININAAFKVHSIAHQFDAAQGIRYSNLALSDDLVTRPEAVHYIRAVMEKTQATTRKTNVGTSPGAVSISRELAATLPLRIDGLASADLSANRTFAVNGLSTIGTANQIPGTNAGATAWEYKTLTAGTGIGIAHGVGTVTITNSDPATGKAANSEAFVTIGNTAGLSAERALTPGDGLDLTDGGANGAATLAVDVTDILGNGLTETSNNIVLGTPGSITSTSANAVTASSHTHAVDSTIAKTTDLHNQSHVLASTTALGADHTVTGLTAGQVLKATGATTAAFGVLAHSQLGSVGANDHHNQSHVLATTSALGPDHTVSGLTAGQVLKATGAATVAFGQLLHSQLGTIGANDHHNQVHSITGSDHTITASQYQIVGATATNTLGLLTPSTTGTANAIAQFDANGRIQADGLGIGTTADLADAITIGSSATNRQQLIYRTPFANNHELLLRPTNTSGVSYLRIAPNGSPGGINATCQVFKTDWLADSTNFESVEMAADGANNIGWIRTNYGGTGTLRPLAITTGAAAITDGIYINAVGSVFIGDTANAFVTRGLTINQGAADDKIMEFKSSDVAHGITTYAETDTFGGFGKYSATAGGLNILGHSSGSQGMVIQCHATTPETTDTSASYGVARIISGKKSGTSMAALAATENVFSVDNWGSTRMIVKGNGDLHVTNTTLVALDEYDDVALLRTLDRETAVSGVVNSQWDKFINYNRKHLEEIGVLCGDFISIQALQRLTTGAIWQLHERIAALEAGR